MEQPVFQIPQKKYREESVVISMRMPKDMLREINEAARLSSRPRNEVLMLALEFAMRHMVITPSEKNTITVAKKQASEKK